MTSPPATPPPRRPLLPRLLPAAGLAFLAPWVAEYLLGLHTLRDLPIIVFLVPLYGCGALLIRELARRTGRGWPTMLLLAAAYGVIEAGLVDQSLFNPDFSGYDFQSAAHVPGLDVSAYSALSFVAGHVIFSIGTPIAIVESLLPERATRPWLRTPGLVGTGLLYLLGAFVIFSDVRATEGFQASPLQLGVAAGVALAFAVAAFAVPRRVLRPPTEPAATAPRARVAGVLAFVAASLLILVPESWLGAGCGLVLVVVAAWAVRRWARSSAWSQLHVAGLAGGALLTYAWVALVLPPWRDVPTWEERASEVAFAVAALVLRRLAIGASRRAGTARLRSGCALSSPPGRPPERAPRNAR